MDQVQLLRVLRQKLTDFAKISVKSLSEICECNPTLSGSDSEDTLCCGSLSLNLFANVFKDLDCLFKIVFRERGMLCVDDGRFLLKRSSFFSRNLDLEQFKNLLWLHSLSGFVRNQNTFIC